MSDKKTVDVKAMLGKKFVPSAAAIIRAIRNHANMEGSILDYVIPLYVSSTGNIRQILCIVGFERQGSTIDQSFWCKEEDLIGLIPYTEETLTVTHKDQTFQLDLNKARQLGLIK